VRRVVSIAAFSSALVLGLALAALVLLLATGTLKAYAIPSSAMEPTLHCARSVPGCEAGRSDRVVALTWFVIDRGDLVAFDAPPEAARKCGVGGQFVKRVIGLPDDEVELRLVRGREHVYINGERLDEPYVDEERRASRRTKSWVIPSGSIFLLGDNRAHSCDSSVWGPLPVDDLTGEVVATYWPPDRWTIR
jgi:signal peptidase I